MMMQYNSTTVSATCEVYSISVQHFLGVSCLSTSTIVTFVSSLLHRTIIFNLLQQFQVLSQIPFMKGKMWPLGNLTENNYNNHQLIM